MDGRDAGARAPGVTRRVVLRDGTAVALAVLVAGPLAAHGDVAVAVTPGEAAFLTPDELRALRGLVDVLIPGADGALASGCAEAIDALLGAFVVAPPRIYAGAPFSDRAGSPVNHFGTFLPLDAYETLAWRLRIEGSQGRPQLEFNGPVTGWQHVYREGLRALDAAAPGGRFAALPAPARELLLRTTDDADIGALVDVAFPHTYEFHYGAPEYGANRDLMSWRATGWAGDVQPRGWTRAQIEEAGGAPAGAREQELLRELLPAAPLAASGELAHNVLARSGGSLTTLRDELAGIARKAGRRGA
ncbi:MAG TPA: gluconate 2-dehydrogenase subunit 3 family protein [Baekduia sp.]|nr:gluconate 2-dehydrogenase subunit 3 family protein [Baekduia sp.]